MPTKSPHASFEVPKEDIWGFMFERKDLPFPEDKSILDMCTPICIPSSHNSVMLSATDSSRTYTYDQVKSTAIDFGKGLKSTWEWRKGDVLALYTPNSIDTPPVMWGTLWAGGVVTPANPGYTVDELVYQLKDSGAKAIITQYPLLGNARKAAEKVGIPEDRIALLGEVKDPEYKVKHFTSIRNTSGATRYRRTKSKSTDLAFLPYSSGTTGRPKGVMLSHRNVTSNILMNEGGESPNLRSGVDSVLAFLPFFHIYGTHLYPISASSSTPHSSTAY